MGNSGLREQTAVWIVAACLVVWWHLLFRAELTVGCLLVFAVYWSLKHTESGRWRPRTRVMFGAFAATTLLSSQVNEVFVKWVGY